MTGVIVRMVKGFDLHRKLAYVRVFPSGELESMTMDHLDRETQRAEVRHNIARTKEKFRRVGSQLLSIRYLSLMGWTVCEPTLWEEAEA